MFYFNPYTIPPLLAAFVILSLGTYVWFKKFRSLTNFAWFLVCVSMFVWLMSDFFMNSTNDRVLAIFFSKIVYVGVTFIPISNAFFAYRISKTRVNILLLVLLFFLYLVAIYFVFYTNKIIYGFHQYSWGLYQKAGLWHWLYLMLWGPAYAIGIIIIRKQSLLTPAKSEERQRLNYIFYTFLGGGLIGSLNFVQKYGVPVYPVGYFAVPLIVAFITLAIYRHSLMDIKIVIKRGIVYSSVIAILTGVYLLLVVLIEMLFRDFVGYRSIFVSLLLTFTIALLFNPLHNKIQALIDHLFLGKTPEEIARENELLRQEVERSERLKAASTLALGLAHEIKNPLTTIKTFSEHLPEKCNDKEFVSKFSSLIPSEVERINNIVHRLLDFSKPSPPSFQKTNVHSLIKDILEFLSNDFLKHRIAVNESYEDGNLNLRVDPGQIKQVILNLLLNAMEAMPTGGNICIKTKKTRGSTFELTIKDEGCGIPPEHIKNLFTPFLSTKEGGSGLGLSICHQIIKNHGGTIEVKSEKNKGTEIRIEFPLREDQA